MRKARATEPVGTRLTAKLFIFVFILGAHLAPRRGFRLALLVAGLLVIFVFASLFQDSRLLKLLLETFQRAIERLVGSHLHLRQTISLPTGTLPLKIRVSSLIVLRYTNNGNNKLYHSAYALSSKITEAKAQAELFWPSFVTYSNKVEMSPPLEWEHRPSGSRIGRGDAIMAEWAEAAPNAAGTLGAAREKIGRRDEFDHLVERYHKQAYNIAYRMTGNHADAEDLTQEAFVRAFRFFGNYRRDWPFDNWLYMIMSNLFVDDLRRRPKARLQSLDQPLDLGGGSDDVFLEIPDASTDPARMMDLRELDETIQNALNSLPSDFRMTVILADMEGFSYEEISAAMHCSLGTVRSRLHRGRKLLRSKIAHLRQEAAVASSGKH
jgi:RNA polymerase sigma-70 factor (ECF subfamily)